MNKIKLPSYGCSQEDHVPNCGHFGESGGYLSPHASTCPNTTGNYECDCNPTSRAEKAVANASLNMPLSLYVLLQKLTKKEAQEVWDWADEDPDAIHEIIAVANTIAVTK